MNVVYYVIHQLNWMEVNQVWSNCFDSVASLPLLVDLLNCIDSSMQLVLSPEKLDEFLSLVG